MVTIEIDGHIFEISKERYKRIILLYQDNNALAKATYSMIRAKKKPHARRIKMGDIKTARSIAKSYYAGTIKNRIDDLCEQLCRLLRQYHELGTHKAAELIAVIYTVIATEVGPWLTDILALSVWIYKEELISMGCDCEALA